MMGSFSGWVAYVGVDPGASDTGVVTLLHNRGLAGDPLLCEHKVVRRQAHWTDTEYLGMVGAEVFRQIGVARAETCQVGVEKVNAPHAWRNGQKVPINPASLIGTSMIYGAVLARFDAKAVTPRRHGSRGRAAYPPALWGPRESDAGTGMLRHCRSAYDVALSLAGKLPELRRSGSKAGPSRGKRDGLGREEQGSTRHPASQPSG